MEPATRTLAERHAKQSEDTERRQQGNESRHPLHLGLDKAPARTRTAESCVEDDSGRAVPGAPQMQSVPSDVDQNARRWRRRDVASSREPLAGDAGQCDREIRPHRPMNTRGIHRRI
jgi:hypothetical protein